MNVKKYVYVLVFSLLMLQVVFLAGCNANQEEASINADASIACFKWGIERAELIAEADKISQKGLEIHDNGERFVTLENYSLLGYKTTVTFSFTDFSPDDYPALNENTGMVLTGAEIFIHAADKSDIISELTAILGEQETRQLHFFNYAGDFGYEYGAELDEANYYWHGSQNLIESLGLDKLQSFYPDMDEQSLVKMFYNTYEYTVSVRDNADYSNLEDGAVTISINATPSVLKDIFNI